MNINNKKTFGFTLVEILVASTVLTLLTFVGYKVFIAMSRSFQKGSWALATQNKLRNALHFIREEMQKASYKTEVTPNGTEVDEDNFKFRLNPNDKVTNDTIAEWYICRTFVDGHGAVFKCELKLENGSLIMSKTIELGNLDPDDKERVFNNYKIIDNVEEVKLTLEPFDPDNKRMGSMVTIEVVVRHHDQDHFPDAQIVDKTGAKVEIEVENL